MSKGSVKTFFITGVTSGLGRAFAEGALAAGHRVIGTVRRQEDADVFSAVSPDSAFPLLLDVTNYESMPAIVGQVEERIGPIDVLVNNAGYGHEGALEESSMGDLQRQFAANVFGLRISRKEGQRFTACRSMVSRHVGPKLMTQDVLNFLSETNIRQ